VADVEETIRRFLGGDVEAFDQLVRKWEARVFNLAWRFLGNRHDAQDVVQETFLSVFQSLNQLRDPKSFPTWLYRIALNHCRANWRARSSNLSLDERVADGEGEEKGPSLASLIAAHSRDPLETVDLVRKAMTSLSQDHRMAIILKEYLGLSLAEVAEVMDCPLSTAKSRLYHGLREVQKNLKRLLRAGMQ
jgi:RNA polymerase sigma-70 factor, ECF subfamily